MNRIIILPLLLVFSFSNAQFLTFPGDVNNDGIANNYDILPIGIGYNESGPAREIPNIDWSPQEFFPWGQNLPFSGVEYAFIDCDGNGMIDSLDIEAIAQNYEMTQNEANPPPIPYELPDTLFTTDIPGLNISFSIDTAFVTDTFFAQININYPGMATDSVLGIAFGLEYDSDLVKDSLTVIFPDTTADDMMFVSAASNFVSIYRAPSPGRVEIGAAGRGQNVISGTRVLAKVRFVVEDVIIRDVSKKFTFAFTDVLMINKAEQVLEIGTYADTIVLTDPINSIERIVLENKIHLFPNPTNDVLNIISDDLVIKNIQLFNHFGQLVKTQETANQRQVQLITNTFSAGVYIVKIQTSQGVLTKKVCFF